MKLEDVFEEPYHIDDISILIDESYLKNMVAMESVWIDAPKKGWSYRVDPVDLRIPQKTHIHISKTKNKNSKNMQVSWNDDGTGHDRKSFNSDIGPNKYVRDLARDILKIDNGIALEDLQDDRYEVSFSEDLLEAYVSL